jgi:hypothetical protein
MIAPLSRGCHSYENVNILPCNERDLSDQRTSGRRADSPTRPYGRRELTITQNRVLALAR